MKPEMEQAPHSGRRARESYNALSRWYDLFSGGEKRFTDAGVQMLGAQSNESILEIGCGTGCALVEFADNVEGGKIIGLDISEGMLKAARRRIQNRIRKRGVGLCQADGLYLPFPSGQFDAIFLSFTLELFDSQEIPRVLKECRRILKVGGRIGVVALAKRDAAAVHLYEWFHRRLPTFVDCRPIFAQSVLKEAQFEIQRSTLNTMWGLPVEIVIARKHWSG